MSMALYQEFYGLAERPFSLTPDPQFFYWSESHWTALESLLYGIDQKVGFMMVTGEIGTGKTTLGRVLLGKLGLKVKTAVIFNSFLNEEELLETILDDFGLPPKIRSRKEKIDELNRFLIDLLARGENAVLIIDEAQNLSIPVMEQIRMLSNLETEKEKALQIIFLGQLELNQKLQTPELKQLNQRLALRLRLLPLSPRQMEEYILQRLIVAGDRGKISFAPAAIQEIYCFSRGIPRLVNLLCDRALLGGFVDQTYHIDQRVVKRAAQNLQGEELKKWSFDHLPRPARLSRWRYVLLMLFLFTLTTLSPGKNPFP